MPSNSAALVGDLEVQALVDWFSRNRRDLPWRKPVNSKEDGLSVGERSRKASHPFQRDPYTTWISEIMLQQTQVSTVIKYFNQWIKTFPDVYALASAGEDKVLEAWAGLGYYSRARNLLATAKTIVADFEGHFPWQRKDLLNLKGIGEYTAGAIASLAFNLPEPILDGNLIRVFSRRYGLEFLPQSQESKSAYWNLARSWVKSNSPALVNEGLMELGATICTPKQPSCESCPLAPFCLAFATHSQDRFPPAKIRKEVMKISGISVIAWSTGKNQSQIQKSNQGEVLLYRGRGSELLKGLWTFPIINVSEIVSLPKAWAKRLPMVKAPKFNMTSSIVTHSITHHQIQLKVATTRVAKPDKGKKRIVLPEGFQWVPIKDLEKLLVSSLSRKIWDSVRRSGSEI